MLEWTASVKMATEPVTVPTTTLSRISIELEATDSAAVRTLTWAVESFMGPASPTAGARHGRGG